MSGPIRGAVLASLAVVAGVAVLAVRLLATNRPASGDQQHGLIEHASPSFTDRQAEIVADGVITLDEYNGAMERVIACVEAGGIQVRRLPGKGVGGSLQFEGFVDTSVIAQGTADALDRDCRDRYTSSLNMIWAEQNRPTQAQAEETWRGVEQCFVDNEQPQLVGQEGLAEPGRLEAGSRAFWIYFGCQQHGAGWIAPPE